MIAKNIPYAIGEVYRGFSIRATVKELQKFVPIVKSCDVIRGPSGVRAQVLSKLFITHKRNFYTHTLYVGFRYKW